MNITQIMQTTNILFHHCRFAPVFITHLAAVALQAKKQSRLLFSSTFLVRCADQGTLV